MQLLRHGLAAVFLAGLTFVTPAAHADLSSVVVSPSTANVGLNGATLSLTWTVNRVGPVAGGAATTSSPSATLVLGGQVLQTSGSLFTSTTTIAPGAAQVLTFTETFTISPAIARRIARGTVGSATINRTFTDTSAVPTITQSVRIALNTGAAGAISVRRIDIAFDDGNRTRVIARGNPLRAIANLRYQGGGVFAGEWRVSVQGGGSNFERRLAIVRQPLSGAGNGATRLVSPPLPVNRPGLYQVRLVPDNATTGLSVPTIRYYVTPENLTRPPELKVSAPVAGSLLTPDTRFAWNPVPRAAAYQIEIFESNGGSSSTDPNAGLLVGSDGLEPLTGRVVPGTATEASIADLTMRHIPPGSAYRWRIRALGPAGETLAISAFRQLRR